MKFKKNVAYGLVITGLLVGLCGCDKEKDISVSATQEITQTTTEPAITEEKVDIITGADADETTEDKPDSKSDIVAIKDAELEGVWNRTGVHRGYGATVEITNQDDEGFDFSGNFMYYSHVGILEGKAYFKEDGTAVYEYISGIEGADVEYVTFTMTGEELVISATGDSGELGFGMSVTANGNYTTEEPEYTNATVLQDNFTEGELESIRNTVSEEYYEEYFKLVVEIGVLEATQCTLEDGTKAVYYEGYIPTMGGYGFELLKCDNGDIYFYSENEEVGWRTNVSGAIDYPAYTEN